MSKFAPGQRVEIAFNPPTPDLRVPNQVNGTAPGRGEFQAKPDFGEVLEVHERENGVDYMVAVELSAYSERFGRKVETKSVRRRVIPEAKLRAVS